MIKRRDILMLGGGSIAALPLTPIPYKLLDDVSIWTQNWPWIPVPKAGELTVRNSVCTLCRGGCPIRVRCVDGRPIGVMPKRNEEGSVSPVCALAFGSHQLPWHPARLKKCLLNGKPATPDEVSAAVAEACRNAGGNSIAILDERPGRAMSALYRRFTLAVKGGVYVTPPMQERATLDAVAALCGAKSRLGFDWSKTATVLSIGAPLLDGFPGTAELAGRRSRGEVRLFHAGSSYSRQAQLAERFFPILPGGEGAFALGLASVLAEKAPAMAGLAEFQSLTTRFPLERAAALSGLKPETIRQLASDLALGAPAVVAGGGDYASGPYGVETETLIAALNMLLGSVGINGGIRPYTGLDSQSGSTPLAQLPDHSVGVLFADRAPAGFALPWSLIERKLAKGAMVVALTCWHRELASRAQAVVAAPAPMEDWTESCSTAQPAYNVAPAVLKRPEGTVRADELLLSVAGQLGANPGEGFDLETALKGRAGEILAARRGSVAGQKITEFATAEDVWKALSEGAEWTDSESSAERLKACLPGVSAGETDRLLAAVNGRASSKRPDEFPLALIATGWIGEAGGLRLPLSRILDKESLLRRPSGRAAVHPSTAASLGLKGGTQVQIETPKGQRRMMLDLDDAVLPGAIEVTPEAADGDFALDLMEPGADGTWGLAWARMRRA